MAVNITEADAYIGANVIVVEDWMDADEANKTRLLNVASRTLATKYPTYTIPDAAVYEFATALATAYNDTNKLAHQGVQSFSLSGVGSFTFRDGAKDLAQLIPQPALDLIGAENPDKPKLSRRNVGYTVL